MLNTSVTLPFIQCYRNRAEWMPGRELSHGRAGFLSSVDAKVKG